MVEIKLILSYKALCVERLLKISFPTCWNTGFNKALQGYLKNKVPRVLSGSKSAAEMAKLEYTKDIFLEVHVVITLTLPVHIGPYLLLFMHTTSHLPFNTTCYSLCRLDAFQFFLQIDAHFCLNFLWCCLDDRCRIFSANKCNVFDPFKSISLQE